MAQFHYDNFAVSKILRLYFCVSRWNMDQLSVRTNFHRRPMDAVTHGTRHLNFQIGSSTNLATNARWSEASESTAKTAPVPAKSTRPDMNI